MFQAAEQWKVPDRLLMVTSVELGDKSERERMKYIHDLRTEVIAEVKRAAKRPKKTKRSR